LRTLRAQHHDLKLPLTAATGEQADNPAQEPVQQRHQHDAQSEPSRPRPPALNPAESNFFTPHVNTTLRLLCRRAYGFHSAEALIALAMLKLGGLCPPLPGWTG